MTTGKKRAVSRHLNVLFQLGVARDLTDGQLLERFSTGQGRDAELAFESLVERHSPMVLRVCRSQLVNVDDVHDAFQATFLILIKKARSLWVRDSLGPWLHRVAFRTAMCARRAVARRLKHEQRAAEIASSMDWSNEPRSRDWENLLHEEVNRLPDCYRVPIVLCDLQGLSCEEAARRMGRPVGTIKSLRSRGRARLRDRLIRRGLAPAVVVTTISTECATQAAISDFAWGSVANSLSQGLKAGHHPASVKLLVKGVFKTMLISKLQMAATALLGTILVTAVLGPMAWGDAKEPAKPGAGTESEIKRPEKIDPPDRLAEDSGQLSKTWTLSLPEAIHEGLKNAENIRLVSVGVPLKIVSKSNIVDSIRLKAEAMAIVRSISQQYWSLVQTHSQLEASKESVKIAKEILEGEKKNLESGRGTVADVAESEQRLQQFNLEVVARTSDVITTERQLRNLLGAASQDGRRIDPTSIPSEDRIQPNWEHAVTEMMVNQPTILSVKAQAKRLESQGDAPSISHLPRMQQEVIQQSTHTLARHFLEVDANYKQFQTAAKFRAAAATRLDAQRTYYNEGRITIDRYFDAVAQYGQSRASEAQFKAAYNISRVAFEESKGTLLDHNSIQVVDLPGPRIAEMGDSVAMGSLPDLPSPVLMDPVSPTPAHSPIAGPTTPKPSDSPTENGLGNTYSFDFKIGGESSPFQVRGSFTVSPARPRATQVKGSQFQ